MGKGAGGDATKGERIAMHPDTDALPRRDQSRERTALLICFALGRFVRIQLRRDEEQQRRFGLPVATTAGREDDPAGRVTPVGQARRAGGAGDG
jgi:hypothetical protein